jgi:hypothetical protein
MFSGIFLQVIVTIIMIYALVFAVWVMVDSVKSILDDQQN